MVKLKIARNRYIVSEVYMKICRTVAQKDREIATKIYDTKLNKLMGFLAIMIKNA
jgi:hypothetical protein